jgi:hypothetical protein
LAPYWGFAWYKLLEILAAQGVITCAVLFFQGPQSLDDWFENFFAQHLFARPALPKKLPLDIHLVILDY